MELNILLASTLGVSLLLIAAAVAVGVWLHRSELKRSGTEGRRRMLTPFRVFLLGFFFAAVAAFFPVSYAVFFASDAGALRVLKAVLLSIGDVMSLFTLNGTFDGMRELLASPSLDAALGAVYAVYALVIYIASPLLTAGFVLSFFRDASAMLRYSLRPCRELYVLSELNERSLALARNIVSEKGHGCLLIFADVFENNEERDYELLLQARQLGAICVKKDVTGIGLKYARRHCKRQIYLIGMNEDENVGQAISLIQRHRGTKYEESLQFYVFTIAAESEALLDTVDNGLMKVRRINEGRNLALQEMREHPIFDHTVKEQGKRMIRLCMVGLGNYGTELIKTICCLAQMPGYAVELHVFDKDDPEKKLKRLAPEFLAGSGVHEEGEEQYDLVFHPADVRGAEFIDQFSSIRGLTGVYVTLGDDELNIETAMRVRRALNRNGYDNATPVYAVVYSEAKAELMQGGGLKSMQGESYGITFIGSLSECYSLNNIIQKDLEDRALRLHIRYAEVSKQKEDEMKFYHYEYYRRTSMMRAIYCELRERIGLRKMEEGEPGWEENNEMLRVFEHRRWNVFMRGEGFIHGKEKDHVAKTHPLLTSYDRLPDSEKRKDDF